MIFSSNERGGRHMAAHGPCVNFVRVEHYPIIFSRYRDNRLSVKHWIFSFWIQDWHGIISSTLGGILLLGTSTLIGIVLIIDSELGPRKSSTANLSSNMFRSAIGLSWFMPTLYAITTPLVYTIVGSWPICWWMPVRSVGCILFIIIETLFFILFSLIFLTLMRKSTHLKTEQDKRNLKTCKRYVYTRNDRFYCPIRDKRKKILIPA